MKGNFTHHERPEMYLFESLALCQRTSEKQSASALDLDHKVKQETHKIIYNVLRCPVEMREILAQVYGEYRHYNAALTLENLAGDFYVPGTNLGRGQGGRWPEIMEVTDACTIAWLERVVSLHRSKAPPGSSVKSQKNAQMSNDMLREMMEMTCVMQWISPSLKKMLGAGPGFEKIMEAWKMGTLDCMKFVLCRCA
ncbi:unnamed protein product [Symbiodinium sp. CCMP2456]|nr:unnamed protein product [Symbiodinium sp. CCMP2456]